MSETEKCPNCPEVKIECCSQHVYTNDGRTYFKAYIYYCPECLYISFTDAKLQKDDPMSDRKWLIRFIVKHPIWSLTVWYDMLGDER